MTVRQARQKNIAKAREALAVKRALARMDATQRAQAGATAVPDAEVTVTLQMLQATIDQAGWQLNVIRQRMGGLL